MKILFTNTDILNSNDYHLANSIEKISNVNEVEKDGFYHLENLSKDEIGELCNIKDNIEVIVIYSELADYIKHSLDDKTCYNKIKASFSDFLDYLIDLKNINRKNVKLFNSRLAIENGWLETTGTKKNHDEFTSLLNYIVNTDEYLTSKVSYVMACSVVASGEKALNEESFLNYIKSCIAEKNTKNKYKIKLDQLSLDYDSLNNKLQQYRENADHLFKANDKAKELEAKIKKLSGYLSNTQSQNKQKDVRIKYLLDSNRNENRFLLQSLMHLQCEYESLNNKLNYFYYLAIKKDLEFNLFKYKRPTKENWLLIKTFLKSISPKHKIEQDVKYIKSSKLFDANWYLNTYPDVKQSNADPAEHYLKHGWKESRKPSLYFDGDWYLQKNPDVQHCKINPLLHYLKFGIDEGRKISPSVEKVTLC